MSIYKGLLFEIITENDINELTPIMKSAFDADTKLHLNEPSGGPPGYDNGDFLRKYAINSGSHAYKVLKDGILIGAVIVWIKKDNVNF